MKKSVWFDYTQLTIFHKISIFIASFSSLTLVGFLVAQSCGDGKDITVQQTPGTQAPPQQQQPTPPPLPNPPDPTPCQVSYEPQVKALISASCGPKCHGEFSEYATAKDYAAKMVERIKLSDPNLHMPKPNNFGYGEPSAADVANLEGWIAAGFPEKASDCEGPAPGGGFRTLQNSLEDANRALDQEDDRQDIRFAFANHITNQTGFAGDIRLYWASVNKALNSLARTEKDIIKCQIVDAAGSVCKLSLSAYGLTAASWNAILREEPFNFPISGSAVGRDIIAKTGSNQPFLHADVLAEFAMRPTAYYAITGIPATFAEYQKQIGSDLEGDIKETANVWRTRRRNAEKVIFAATNDTAISDSNRMVIHFESQIDKCTITFDVIDGNADVKNILRSPLLVVGKNQFQPDGSETLCLMENGMIEGGLFDAAGNRADIAPTNLVIDFETKLQAKDIFTYATCGGCHAKGLRPIQDKVRDSYNDDPDDAFLVQGLYGTQVQINAFQNGFNATHQAALAKLGLTNADPEPWRYTREQMLLPWDFSEFCAFIMLTETECKRKFDISNQARAKLGGLLQPNGTATFAQVVDAFPDVIREFQLGQDEIR